MGIAVVLALSLLLAIAFLLIIDRKGDHKVTHSPVYVPDSSPSQAEKRAVSYFSRKHGGWRHGHEVCRDGSGRVIIHLLDHPEGVYVRRQPHLVKQGWVAKRFKSPDGANSNS